MLAIGAIEVASLLIGFSPSASLESALPDAPEIDADVPDASGAELGAFSQVLGWLSIGRLPILVLLVIFLTSFALSGYAVQWLAAALVGGPLNAWIATIPALVGGAYGTRHFGRWLGAIFPRDHTEAASQKDMIGSYATILRGEAVRGQPAEAKTYDLRGRSHYVRIEPDEEGVTYAAGQRVFIVGHDKGVYRAVTRINTDQGESNG